jgi:hypothetical protein
VQVNQIPQEINERVELNLNNMKENNKDDGFDNWLQELKGVAVTESCNIDSPEDCEACGS